MCVLLEAWTRSWGKMGQICGFGWSEARWRWHRVQKETKSEAGTVGKQGGELEGQLVTSRIRDMGMAQNVEWGWQKVRNGSQFFGSESGNENIWSGFLGTDPGGRLSFQRMLAAWLPLTFRCHNLLPIPGTSTSRYPPTTGLWTAEVKRHDWRREAPEFIS